jgi:DnaK suppressor protein
VKKSFRKRLAALEQELLGSINDQRQEYDELVSGDRTEETDEATIRNAERALAALLLHDRRRLDRVQAAIGRLETGHFGLCAACGEHIDPQRLEARPDAVFCYECATKRQRAAGPVHLN